MYFFLHDKKLNKMIIQEVLGTKKRAYSHSMTDYYQMQFS